MDSTAEANTWSGVKFTACFICTGEVGMNTWIKPTSQANAASMSPFVQRDNAQISEDKPKCAISLTTLRSPSELLGKPASGVDAWLLNCGDFDFVIGG
jgi:hypothetical protein